MKKMEIGDDDYLSDEEERASLVSNGRNHDDAEWRGASDRISEKRRKKAGGSNNLKKYLGCLIVFLVYIMMTRDKGADDGSVSNKLASDDFNDDPAEELLNDVQDVSLSEGDQITEVDVPVPDDEEVLPVENEQTPGGNETAPEESETAPFEKDTAKDENNASPDAKEDSPNNEETVLEENDSATDENETMQEEIEKDADATSEVISDIAQPANTEPEEEPTSTTKTVEKNTIIDTDNKPGFKKHPAKLSDTYIPRHYPPMTEAQRKELEDKWGAWTLPAPPIVEDLPIGDYPNGDVPREAFPQNSWQTDPEFLKDWLPEGIALAERAMEAILSEYGHGKDENPDKTFAERSAMFTLKLFASKPSKSAYSLKHPPGDAGYATLATLEATKRRILHSIMTQDTFLVAMGGHSAAAGHGNNFRQSYTLQAQRILEPIFARLGVYHQAHNFGMGGLGTSQNALASGSIYGKHIDILLWDSGMTEPDEPSKDLFARQGILAGEKVPVLWGVPDNGRYQEQAPEIGLLSSGFWGAYTKGIPLTESADQVFSLPFATWYLECTKEAGKLCKNIRYNSTCWVPRDDVTPPKAQDPHPGGQASWHAGNRVHQLRGRSMAFTILQQLHKGLQEWYAADDYALPDDAWHLTEEFDRMRDAVANYDGEIPCHTFYNKWKLTKRVCHIPLFGKSEFTPRYDPGSTSLRSIVMEGVKVSEPEPNLYDPPDAHAPIYDPPEGEVDVLRIIENGIDFSPNRARREAVAGRIDAARKTRKLVKSKTDLPPGQGWGLDTNSNPDACDGTWDSFCNRNRDNPCLLNGHNDHRGGLRFDSFSGWLKLNLENVTEGIIIVRIEDWIGAEQNKATEGWVCENNAPDCEDARNLSEENRENLTTVVEVSGNHRSLKGGGGPKCHDWKFEYAIDGKVTTWDEEAWNANRKQVQRVVHLWQLLDDPDYTKDKADKNVELAMRLTGCKRVTVFQLSHVYWA